VLANSFRVQNQTTGFLNSTRTDLAGSHTGIVLKIVQPLRNCELDLDNLFKTWRFAKILAFKLRKTATG